MNPVPLPNPWFLKHLSTSLLLKFIDMAVALSTDLTVSI